MMQSRRKSTLCCTFVALSVPFPSDQGLFPARTIAVLVLLLKRPGSGRCTMIYATGFFPHSSSALIGLLLWLLRCNYWFYEVNNLLWFCGTECKPLSEHNVSTCFLVFFMAIVFFSVKESEVLLITMERHKKRNQRKNLNSTCHTSRGEVDNLKSILRPFPRRSVGYGIINHPPGRRVSLWPQFHPADSPLACVFQTSVEGFFHTVDYVEPDWNVILIKVIERDISGVYFSRVEPNWMPSVD